MNTNRIATDRVFLITFPDFYTYIHYLMFIVKKSCDRVMWKEQDRKKNKCQKQRYAQTIPIACRYSSRDHSQWHKSVRCLDEKERSNKTHYKRILCLILY